MTPEEVKGLPWMHRVKGEALIPDNTSTTCSAGAEGRMIDFAVAHRSLVGQCELEADLWGDHGNRT